MMKKYIASMALSVLSAVAVAGGYVGASVGKGKISYSCNENLNCKHSDNVFKIYAGTRLKDADKIDLAGFAVVDALEVAYLKTSKVSSTGAVSMMYNDTDANDVLTKDVAVRYRIGLDALIFAPVIRVQVDSDASVFSKVGLGIVSSTLSNDLDGRSNKSETANKFKPYIAFGADYRVVESLKVFGMLDFLPYEVNGVKGTARSLAVGAEYSY
jgi:hypothetical protein